MTHTIINILIFGLISNINFSQTIEIRGKIIDYKTLLPLSGVNIQLNDSIGTITNNNSGEFKIMIPNQNITDSIMIYSIGYRPLIIKNIPQNKGNTNLKTVPMFLADDFTSMVDFFCCRLNFICKFRERRYWKKERLKSERLRKETDSTIKDIRYIFNNYVYEFDYSKNAVVLDLSKPVGKWTY